MRKRVYLLRPFLAVVAMLMLTVAACSSSEATMTPERAEQAYDGDAEYEREMPELFPASLELGEKLQVVATTNIVADVVKNIGGDWIELTTLMPLGTDPHAFEPTPRDVAAISDAHVIFANGAGLEQFLEPLLESTKAEKRTVYVSQGVALRELAGDKGSENDHDHAGDPHTWTDPNNVVAWTHNIEHALGALDPENETLYRTNAEAYEAMLEDLDVWIEEEIAKIPQADRRMVTDHATFGYLADRYHVELIGAIIPSYSTLSEPSAQELADLQDAIRDLGVKAVFVGNTVNPGLAQRIAEDTGVQLVYLYTGSLSAPGGPADSYLKFMRYNVSEIVNALRR